MNELKTVISQEIVESGQKKIVVLKNNFDSIEAELTETLAVHMNAVYTEDSKQSAKKDVAEIRKGEKAFKSAFTEAKNELLEPAVEITPQYQRIVELFGKAVTNIADQVKKMEEAEKEKKRVKCTEYFNEKTKGFERLFSFDDVFNPKWLNASTSWKSVTEGIDSKVLPIIEKYEREIEFIKNMGANEDITKDALDQYEKEFDLTKAVETIRIWERQEAAILAREKEKQRLAKEQEELDRRQEEQRKRDELEAEKRRMEAEKQAEIEKVREEERKKVEAELAFERAEADRKIREEQEAERLKQQEEQRKQEELAEAERIEKEKEMQEKKRNKEETYSVIAKGLTREQMEKLSESLSERHYTVECRLEE